MNKKTFQTILSTIALACALMLQPLSTIGAMPPPQDRSDGGSVSLSNQSGRVQIKLDRGSKVSISNRYGRITVTGWDSDTVEATATSDKGPEAIQVEMTADPSARSVLSLSVVGRQIRRATTFSPNPNRGNEPERSPRAATPRAPKVTTTAPPAQPAQPAKSPDSERHVIVVPMPNVVVTPKVVVTPGASGAYGIGIGIGGGVGGGVDTGGGSDQGITLDVKMPRYAELDGIEVRYGDLNISGVDGPVSISSGSSNINVSRVGALEVHARSGNVNVEDVSGLVYVVATSGNITVRRSGGDVRATSINGDIDIQCVRGRVDASNARGKITLGGIDGDVEATTTSADINYTGAIHAQGRYRLKSMEGGVHMSIPENSPGFTAILASYNNEVQTDFPIKSSTAPQGSMYNRRVESRQGDGQAQIMLDSFGQPVRLSKAAPGTSNSCK